MEGNFSSQRSIVSEIVFYLKTYFGRKRKRVPREGGSTRILGVERSG